jgi:hypothetical protein
MVFYLKACDINRKWPGGDSEGECSGRWRSMCSYRRQAADNRGGETER